MAYIENGVCFKKRRYYVNEKGENVYIEGKKISRGNAPTRDVVYLLNGSIIRGTIIEQVFSSHVKTRTNDGSVFVFKNEEIDKILKEQDYFKQKNDS
jgi:hypothetical protein